MCKCESVEVWKCYVQGQETTGEDVGHTHEQVEDRHEVVDGFRHDLIHQRHREQKQLLNATEHTRPPSKIKRPVSVAVVALRLGSVDGLAGA